MPSRKRCIQAKHATLRVIHDQMQAKVGNPVAHHAPAERVAGTFITELCMIKVLKSRLWIGMDRRKRGTGCMAVPEC